MKNILPAITVLAALLLAPCSVFAQGALTPSGVPAPTMKSLQQVEPRVDVATLAGDATNHIVISNAGSYYLSSNLAVTKTNGIAIAAAGVTLDLNGFEIARVSGSGGDGIRLLAGSDRATIRAGTIRGFSHGINSSQRQGCHYEWLAVTDCTTHGILAGDGARVLDCRAHDLAGSGISGGDGSVITGCAVRTSAGTYGIATGLGGIIRGCTVQSHTGLAGISGGQGSTISDCVVQLGTSANPTAVAISGGNGSTISGCTARGNNTEYGFFGNAGSLVRDCAVYDHEGNYAIYGASHVTIRGCAAYSSRGTGAASYGIFGNGGNLIVDCISNSSSNTNSPSTSSQGVGIYGGTGGTIRGCSTKDNRGDGIVATFNCRVEGNNCSGNGTSFSSSDGAGIHITGSRTRIEGNSVSGNDRGIDVDGTACLIIRNSAANNTINYVIGTNNVYGPIVDRTAPASPAVSGNAAVSTAGLADPAANHSH